MYNVTNIESTRFSYYVKKYRSCASENVQNIIWYVVRNSGGKYLSYLPVKGYKLALAKLLAVTGYSQNYESAKQIIKMLNLDFYFFPPILTIVLIVTSISIVLLFLPLFLPLLHVIILLILLFWSGPFYFSSRSLLTHPLLSFLSFLTSSFAWLISPLQISLLSAFLDSLVFLQFLYVSSSPFLVHFSLFIPVVYITCDIPSTPLWYSGSLYSFYHSYF
jgi:hypothetical protein